MDILIFRICFFYFKSCIALLVFVVTACFCDKNYSLEHATISIYAVESKTGAVLIDQNSDLSLVPASCMKIATTAAALQLLGADNRFETNLEYDGFISQDQILKGNLYVTGGGDPCLGSDRIYGKGSWKKQIKTWADAIQKLGIKKITGKIIGDTTKWEEEVAIPSWSWEDLGNYYGATASALSFHENYYDLFFRPGKQEGEQTSILRTDPPLSSLIFLNEVKTGPRASGDNACIYGSGLSLNRVVCGAIPLGVDEFAIKGAISNPALLCISLLMKELQERGVVIEQKNIKPGKKNIFYTTYSPPIKEIVHWTNQKSINLYAEHLLKEMGKTTYGKGSTSAGIKSVKTFWESQKIDLDGFNMEDGSGLSRKNLVTAKQLVAMLVKMKKSENFPIFFESLPKQEGSIRAKSGYMSLVRGYAGYKDDIAFAILINQCSSFQKMNNKIHLFLSDLNQMTFSQKN